MARLRQPGPFTVGEMVNLTIRIEEPERTAALVLVEPGRTAQSEATARLFAAAPDLLDALEDAVKVLENLDGMPYGSAAAAISRARVAIASVGRRS